MLEQMDAVSAARSRLLDMIAQADAFEHPSAEIERMQITAADALFQELRLRIAVLDRRARETGIERIGRFDDIVPLLFAHTVYKSYPESFIQKGRWDRMLAWLSTLSSQDLTGIDVKGVATTDDWLQRLQDNDCMVLATSGSSGKCSFLPASGADKALKRRHFKYATAWPNDDARNQYEVFWTGPIEGPNSAIESGQMIRDLWAKPNGFHYLIKETLRMTDISAAMAFMTRLREGNATPAEIAAQESKSAAAAARMNEGLATFTEDLLAHRHAPVMVTGLWSQHMQIIEYARARGVRDGEFHPASRVSAGGGIKGVSLPDDYQAQVDRFYGNVQRPGTYGMTELAQLMPRCEAKRYHRPPGLIWLQLDQPGERLVNARDGVVAGRFAFLDLIYTGRWGGLITGDKVDIDWGGRCPCGRPGPTMLDTIARYTQAGGDDHIGCAGTIEGYVRGAMGA